MKKLGLFMSAVLAFAAVGCSSSNKEAKEEKAEEQVVAEETLLPEGYWRLTDYVAADGTVTEVPTDAAYILSFDKADQNFSIKTDCNQVGGKYKVVGDSITFEDLFSTRMACPETKVEDAMNALLPRVDTYAINPDSILRLRSDMRIMATFVKTTEEAAQAAAEQ